MKLEDILDPEEYKAVQWRIENLPARSFSPEEYIYTRIKEDFRYIEMPEDKKESFLYKVKSFVESEIIDFTDEDSNMILELVTDVLREINNEFDNAFEP
ncbi:MAG: hypothetical protein LBU84_17135 [Prevotella sp.]|jgi:hypothetical protein|nr:hypothetical protein [Prevotella sp.]